MILRAPGTDGWIAGDEAIAEFADADAARFDELALGGCAGLGERGSQRAASACGRIWVVHGPPMRGSLKMCWRLTDALEAHGQGAA